MSNAGNPSRCTLTQPPSPRAANVESTVAATSTSGANAARNRTYSTARTTTSIAGISTFRSRTAAVFASNAWASDPPTSAVGSA